MNLKPVILAIETSSRVGSVALGFGDKIVAEKSFSGFMKHSSEVFPAVNSLLNEFGVKPNGIEHLYISNGPGSFTGLRIAVSIAKMMYLATSLKIIAVDSLDVVAFNAIEAIEELNSGANLSDKVIGNDIKRIAPIIDAKRGQFFIAQYNKVVNGNESSLDKLMDDSIMTAEEFCKKVSEQGFPICLLGDGLLYYKKEFQGEGMSFFEDKYWSPRAACVYKIGWKMAQNDKFTDPLKLKPNYLYRPEIHVKMR